MVKKLLPEGGCSTIAFRDKITMTNQTRQTIQTNKYWTCQDERKQNVDHKHLEVLSPLLKLCFYITVEVKARKGRLQMKPSFTKPHTSVPARKVRHAWKVAQVAQKCKASSWIACVFIPKQWTELKNERIWHCQSIRKECHGRHRTSLGPPL